MDWLAYRAHTHDCPPTAKGPILTGTHELAPNKKNCPMVKEWRAKCSGRRPKCTP